MPIDGADDRTLVVFDHHEFDRICQTSGKTNECLGQSVDRSSQTIKAYRDGKATPPSSVLMRWCLEVGCDPRRVMRLVPAGQAGGGGGPGRPRRSPTHTAQAPAVVS